MKVSAKSLAYIAVNRGHSPFYLRINQAVVANVSWGLFVWGEADIVAVSKSGYLIEGEIKISKADLLKDKHKKKFTERYYDRWKKDIKSFYYIVPTELVEEALKTNLTAGVIEVDGDNLKVHRRSEISKQAVKLSEKNLFNLMRLGCMRAWK